MTRRAFSKIAIILTSVSLMLLAAYWAAEPYWEMLCKQREARNYRERLVAEIEGADHVNVVEHSSVYDLLNCDGLPVAPQDIIEYRSIVLTPQQKIEFASIVRATDPSRDPIPNLRPVTPHYTIQFFRANRIRSQIDICFSSAEVLWYKGLDLKSASGRYPGDLLPQMKKWIVSLGLTPDADWQERAEQAGAHQPATTPADKPSVNDQSSTLTP